MAIEYYIDLPCKINTKFNTDVIEIMAVITCKASIEENEYITEILGQVNLEENGYIDLDIPSRIEIKKMNFTETLLHGVLEYEKSRFNTHSTIDGKLQYAPNELNEKLLDGQVTLMRDFKYIIPGRLELEKEHVESTIDGILEYESRNFSTSIQGRVKLDRGNDLVQDLLNGTLEFEKDEFEKDICTGKLMLYNRYMQVEFPCRIKVKQKRYKYSIFSKIEVVNGFEFELPSSINVDGTTEVSTAIDGTVNIDREEYETDLLTGMVDVYPHVFTYLDGIVTLDSTYTRREFNCSIDVVQEAKIEVPCKITIKERPRTNYINNLLLCRAFLGNRMSYTIDSKIHVRNIAPKPDDIIPIPDLPGVAGGRIVIAVSPTWSYNPFVFKSSLITFLDRYYNVYDFNFVFGGNPRSDWDILNLCNNYQIRKEKLHQVKMRYKVSDPAFNKMNIDHFIKHMFMDYSKKEYKNILRVFLFMNQPTWYYNDPLAKIAEVCKMNNISCVAINSGGEYQEITMMDRLRDRMYNTLEIDRQNRMQRDIYHVVSTDIDPRDITY